MLSVVLEIIGAIWLLVCMAILLAILIDVFAERCRKYRSEYESRRTARDFRVWQREMDKHRHPASRCFVSGEVRK